MDVHRSHHESQAQIDQSEFVVGCFVKFVSLVFHVRRLKLDCSTMASADGKSVSQAIPTRRVELSDPSQIPGDYSTTPGGTWFSTTPGGTRIVYDRSKLMLIRSSPLAQTPPRNMARIPGITFAAPDTTTPHQPIAEEPAQEKKEETEKSETTNEEQFDMEM